MQEPERVVKRFIIPCRSIRLDAYICNVDEFYFVDVRYPDGGIAAGTLDICSEYMDPRIAELDLRRWCASMGLTAEEIASPLVH